MLGVPSSAGGHTPGMDLAPGALRAAGLLAGLAASGGSVVDHGDVAGFGRVPDPSHPDRQNIVAVARVARETASAVASIVKANQVPLVIGGDCTVTIGVVAGMRLAAAPTALLYFDGGPDLYTPGRIEFGNVDAMGLAHMLAIPGSDPVLTDIGGAPPLLQSQHVVLYGDAVPDSPTDLESVLMQQLALTRIQAELIHADVGGAAETAKARIEGAGDRFIVHFDVDVLGHMHMPLANMPNSDAAPLGLTVHEVITSLQIIAASPKFAGIVLTEVNPNNAPADDHLDRYIQMIIQGLSHVR